MSNGGNFCQSEPTAIKIKYVLDELKLIRRENRLVADLLPFMSVANLSIEIALFRLRFDPSRIAND